MMKDQILWVFVIDCFNTVLTHLSFLSWPVEKPHLKSVKRLHEISTQNLQVQISIVVDKCKIMNRLLDIFQSRYPFAPKCLTTWRICVWSSRPTKISAIKRAEYLTCILLSKCRSWKDWNRHIYQCTGQTEQIHLWWTTCHWFPQRGQGLWSSLYCIYEWYCVQLQIHPTLQWSRWCLKMSWMLTSRILVPLHFMLQHVEW